MHVHCMDLHMYIHICVYIYINAYSDVHAYTTYIWKCVPPLSEELAEACCSPALWSRAKSRSRMSEIRVRSRQLNEPASCPSLRFVSLK